MKYKKKLDIGLSILGVLILVLFFWTTLDILESFILSLIPTFDSIKLKLIEWGILLVLIIIFIFLGILRYKKVLDYFRR